MCSRLIKTALGVKIAVSVGCNWLWLHSITRNTTAEAVKKRHRCILPRMQMSGQLVLLLRAICRGCHINWSSFIVYAFHSRVQYVLQSTYTHRCTVVRNIPTLKKKYRLCFWHYRLQNGVCLVTISFITIISYDRIS